MGKSLPSGRGRGAPAAGGWRGRSLRERALGWTRFQFPLLCKCLSWTPRPRPLSAVGKGTGEHTIPSLLPTPPRPAPLEAPRQGGAEPQERAGRARRPAERAQGRRRPRGASTCGGAAGGPGSRGGGFTSLRSSRMVAASRRGALFLPGRLSPPDQGEVSPKMPGAPRGPGAARSRCAVRDRLPPPGWAPPGSGVSGQGPWRPPAAARDAREGPGSTAGLGSALGTAWARGGGHGRARRGMSGRAASGGAQLGAPWPARPAGPADAQGKREPRTAGLPTRAPPEPGAFLGSADPGAARGARDCSRRSSPLQGLREDAPGPQLHPQLWPMDFLASPGQIARWNRLAFFAEGIEPIPQFGFPN